MVMAKKSANRVQLDLSDDAMKQLNYLKDITAASTNAEVFKEAMASHAWLVERYQKGEKILVKPPGNEPREVEILNFTVTTVGDHRHRILNELLSAEALDMRINETDIQMAFPRVDFQERVAAGEYGFNLVDKTGFKAWLDEHGLKMKTGKIETDLYTRWLDVIRL